MRHMGHDVTNDMCRLKIGRMSRSAEPVNIVTPKVSRIAEPKGVKDSGYLKKPITKVFSLFDSHYPYHINIQPLLKFIVDWNPDIFVFGGDNWSLDCISHWNEHTFKNIGLNNIMDAFNKEAVGFKEHVRLFRKAAPNAKFVYILGNHEDWLEQFCQSFPQVKKPSVKSVLEEVGEDIEFIPRGGFYRIGKMNFAHGDQFGTQNPAKQAVERCGETVVLGHHHCFKVWPRFSMVDDHNKYLGIQVPCYTGRSPKYGKGKPNNWQNGFLTACIKPSGNFNHHAQLVSPKGHFITQQGVEYK